MKEKLENLIRNALVKVGGPSTISVEVEHPTSFDNGDYSTNVALRVLGPISHRTKEDKNTGRKESFRMYQVGSKTFNSPLDLAKSLVEAIGQVNNFEKIEIAGPGFINFYLAKEFFVEEIKKILKEGDRWGRNKNLAGQKIIIEHTQPNPFKEFHIGHLVNNIVGEAVSRLLEAEAPKLKCVTYHGDVGLHVAKAIWAIIDKNFDYSQLTIHDLGKFYAEGDRAYEGDEVAKKEIVEINKKIYDESDPEINKIYKKGRELSLQHFEEIYTRLGSRFDGHFFESQAGEIGKKLVEKNPDIFEKSDGAIIFSEEKSGLHTRVFINSEGLPTYEAKDLGLIELKRKFFKFDRSITVTDVEQAEYYKVVMKAAEFVFPDLNGKIEHLSHGRLRLPEGRMSSRTGSIISGEWLLNELQKMALEKMKDRQIEKKEEVADQIAVAALKYSILKQALGRNIVFDFEKSLSFEGDSGPYLQYSAVRAKSVLEKARTEKVKAGVKRGGENVNDVEKLLYRFPSVVEVAARDFAPQKLVTYLIELAGAFNSFYAKEKIVDLVDQNSPYKIALTEAFLITLTNGLNLLGIKVPEKM